jgi:hypothetical protein
LVAFIRFVGIYLIAYYITSLYCELCCAAIGFEGGLAPSSYFSSELLEMKEEENEEE